MPPSFAVTGGRPLKGTIRPAGNKNAALPILAATLLADGPCRIDNVPHIRDVETMLELLTHLGATVAWTGPNSVDVDAARAEPRELDPALGARIRASILLAGPILARFGRVSLPPPGGDVIGRRRVDTHFLALERLGAAGAGGPAPPRAAKPPPRPPPAPHAGRRAARPGPRPLPHEPGRRGGRRRDQHAHGGGRPPAQGWGGVRPRARSHRDRLLHRARGRHQRLDHDRRRAGG